MKGHALVCVLLACSPSVPADLPRTSAASESASAAPLPSTGPALGEDEPALDAGGAPMHHPGMEGMPGMSHGAP